MNSLKVKQNQYHDDQTSQIVGWGHWFTLFNIFVVIALGSQYFVISDWPPTLMGRIYAIISCIGHFSFLTFITYLFFIFPWSFFVHSIKWQQVIATLVATIGVSLLLLDIQVFKLFRIHLNFSVFNLLVSSDSGVPYTRWQRLFIFVPAILLIELIFALWSWKKIRSLNKRRKYSKPFVYLFMFCFFSFHIIHIWADANFYRPINMQRASLPLYSPLTAKHLLSKYGLINSDEYQLKLKELGNPFAANIEYPIGAISYQKKEQPKYNVLLINIESWYDENALGRVDKQTPQVSLNHVPNLAHFSSEHLNFTRHYSSSPNEALGLLSLYYGLDPNYYNSVIIGKKFSVLLNSAIENQYHLGLFSSNGFDEPLYREAMLSSFSMESTTQTPQTLANNWISWYQTQHNKNSEMQSGELDGEKTTNVKPWFSIVEFNPMKVKNSTKQMNQYMLSTDRAIGLILEQLQKDGALSNTVVIITAANRWLPDDKRSFYDRQTLNVPLIVAWPEKSPEVISYLTSHVDVSTTLIQRIFKANNATRLYSNGSDLFDPNHKNWMVAGDKKQIAGLYPTMTLVVNEDGNYSVYALNGTPLDNSKVTLSTFLELMSENRHFMVNY